LSDALHEALVRRFVDESGRHNRRRRRAPATGVVPSRGAPSLDDRVAVDPNHPFARLAALRAPGAPELVEDLPLHALEAAVFAPKAEFSLDEKGHFSWQGQRLGHLVGGASTTTPEAKVGDLGELPGTLRPRLRARLVAYGREVVRDLLAPLSGLEAESRPPEIRGLAYALREGLGTIPAGLVARVAGQDGLLNARGIVQGQRYTYLKVSLRPDALVRRATLVAAFRGKPAVAFDPTATTLARVPGLSSEAALRMGFVEAGPRLVRVDVVERILARAAEGSDDVIKWLARPEAEARAVLAALTEPTSTVTDTPLPST
jgi:hypothetical protein